MPLQRNKAASKGTKKERDEGCDTMTEDYLDAVGYMYERLFYQDLPFSWHQNKDHALFSHPFFTRYADEWKRWCLIMLNWAAYLESCHYEQSKACAWDDAVPRIR